MNLRLFFALLLVCLSALPTQAGSILRDDGVHTEDWFKNLSFLELEEDLREALDAGKTGLVIVFEQPGCGACRRLHEVNFQDPETRDFVSKHFDVLVLNMYGDNLVTNFDGEEMREGAFNERLRINFSPTTVFFGPGGEEVFRIPGYLAPRFYLAAFKYVVDGGPGKGILFPRWLRQQRDAPAAAGAGPAS